jgi:predicted amidohydrolase YtcJ
MIRTLIIPFSVLTILGCVNKVDLIVHNANVYTINADFDKATAFVVDDGKFIAVGGDDLINKYTPRSVVDAQGLSVFPGLIDSHAHAFDLGLDLLKIDLKGSKNFDDVIKKLIKHNNSHKSELVFGTGWDQNNWNDNEYPDKSKLDLFFPNTPVILKRIDGNAFFVNQVALDKAGITSESKINRGKVVLTEGRPSGLLINTAMRLVEKIIPKPSNKDKIKALIDAQTFCFEKGLTTIAEAGISKEDVFLIDSLQKAGVIKLRFYAMLENEKQTLDHFLNSGILKTESLNVRSVKVLVDGELESRGAALKENYSDDSNNKGVMHISSDSLIQLALLLSKKSFQMNAFAIGDAANHAILNAFEVVLPDVDDPRWRIEHAKVVSKEDFSKFNNKIVPSVQPTHVTSDIEWVLDRLGSSRIKGAYAYRDLLDWSGKLSLGSDFPVEKVNPFLTFYTAVARKAPESSNKGFQMENALTRYEAIKGMTIWGAYANFEEDEKGSIEPGKFADFIILDKDIMKVDINRVIETNIVATILNGNIVFSNRF